MTITIIWKTQKNLVINADDVLPGIIWQWGGNYQMMKNANNFLDTVYGPLQHTCGMSINYCDNNAVCIDKPLPAPLLLKRGRTCACFESFFGSGEIGNCTGYLTKYTVSRVKGSLVTPSPGQTMSNTGGQVVELDLQVLMDDVDPAERPLRISLFYGTDRLFSVRQTCHQRH